MGLLGTFEGVFLLKLQKIPEGILAQKKRSKNRSSKIQTQSKKSSLIQEMFKIQTNLD